MMKKIKIFHERKSPSYWVSQLLRIFPFSPQEQSLSGVCSPNHTAHTRLGCMMRHSYDSPSLILTNQVLLPFNWHLSLVKWPLQASINPSHKSHNASDKYPTLHHFATGMCTHVHVFLLSVENGALWDMGLVHCGICKIGLTQPVWVTSCAKSRGSFYACNNCDGQAFSFVWIDFDL